MATKVLWDENACERVRAVRVCGLCKLEGCRYDVLRKHTGGHKSVVIFTCAKDADMIHYIL